MAASLDLMGRLHEMLAEAMLEELKFAKEEGMPIPASDKAAIAKFLKDNNVTADPAAAADLEALQAALLEKREDTRDTRLKEKLTSLSPEAIETLYGAH